MICVDNIPVVYMPCIIVIRNIINYNSSVIIRVYSRCHSVVYICKEWMDISNERFIDLMTIREWPLLGNTKRKYTRGVNASLIKAALRRL